MKRFKKRGWLVAVALVAALGLAWLVWIQLRPTPVPALRVMPTNAVAYLTVTGQVEARNAVAVSPAVTARIDAITVDEGDRVRPGQPLLRLEQTELLTGLRVAEAKRQEAEATLAETLAGTRPQRLAQLAASQAQALAEMQAAKTELSSAQQQWQEAQQQVRRLQQAAQLARQAGLGNRSPVSAQEHLAAETDAATRWQQVQQAKAQVKLHQARLRERQAQYEEAQAGATAESRKRVRSALATATAEVDVQQAEIARRTLHSPVRGIVIQRLQDVGDLATPGQPVLRLADQDTLEVVAQLEEADRRQVQPGQTAWVLLDADPERPLPGIVHRVGSRVNADNGTLPLTITLRPQDRIDLLPGMTADVNLKTAVLPGALVAPVSAIDMETDPPTVWRLADGQARRQPVRVRRLSLEQMQILSGLRSGEWIARDASKDWGSKPSVTPAATPEARTRAGQSPR
jgi:RND family efflux transporter MFP subunit